MRHWSGDDRPHPDHPPTPRPPSRPAPAPRRPRRRRPPGGRRRTGGEAVPGQAAVRALLRPAGRGPGGAPGAADRVGNVVFMGMGEPLANYAAVLRAVRRLVAPTPDGLGMSARGITVSTVGLVPAIDRLAAEDLPVTLALSLHAPDD